MAEAETRLQEAREAFIANYLVMFDCEGNETPLDPDIEDDLDALLAAARAAVPPPFEAALLREALTDILSNVRYERDDDGNWHSFYSDKPRAAAATERAHALTATEQGGPDG